MNEEEFFPACVFRVAYGSQMCQSVFTKLLGGMPEVDVMIDPA